MKRAVLLLGLVVLMAGAVPASAQFGEEREEKYLQVPHRWHIFVDGAMAMPTEPGKFNDYWNTAFQFAVGAGIVVFPWLEVNGTYTSQSFSNNHIESKDQTDYIGTQDLQEGAIHTTMYYGSAKFIAVPRARTNPFIEIGIGGFSTKADDLIIEGVLRNEMQSVSGMCFVPTVGLQYAMNEKWSAYARYTYAMNLNSEFAPGDLLLPVNEDEPTVGGNQVISSLGVGIILKL